MVAAALQILATLARDPEQRHSVVGPWSWDLRRRARQFEHAGQFAAAAQARVIARLVSAVALGEASSTELANAAAELEVNADEFQHALHALESAMHAS